MSPRLWRLQLIAVPLRLVLLASCGGGAAPTPTARPEPPPAADLAFPTTLSAGPEDPLSVARSDIPSVLIVGLRQAKAGLAAYLKTTVENLDYVNPGLDDPVLPGTLVVVPSVHRAAQGETLSSIATQTGLPESELLVANPGLDAQTRLADGTLLLLPSLIFVPADTPLGAAADTLAITDDALLSANPDLAGDTIRAAALLVMPVDRREGP